MQYHLRNIELASFLQHANDPKHTASEVEAYLNRRTHNGTPSVMDWPPQSFGNPGELFLEVTRKLASKLGVVSLELFPFFSKTKEMRNGSNLSIDRSIDRFFFFKMVTKYYSEIIQQSVANGFQQISLYKRSLNHIWSPKKVSCCTEGTQRQKAWYDREIQDTTTTKMGIMGLTFTQCSHEVICKWKKDTFLKLFLHIVRWLCLFFFSDTFKPIFSNVATVIDQNNYFCPYSY